MKELTELAEALLSVINKLIASSPVVVGIVVTVIFLLFLYRSGKFVLKYTLHASKERGHLESIAVGYKALYDDISPAQALKQIQAELDDL